jgi:CheY-like chemotaxis protein
VDRLPGESRTPGGSRRRVFICVAGVRRAAGSGGVSRILRASHDLPRVHSAQAASHRVRRHVKFPPQNMPGMSGYQLAALLKTGLGANCPRLFAVSGGIEESEARNDLFDGMFHKPVDLRLLRESLRATLPPRV